MRYQVKQVALIVALFATMACGMSARQKAIDISYTTLKASQAAFVVWDADHQQSIVDHATSAEDGKAKLAAYREKQAKVMLSFSTAWSALAAASLYDQPGWLAAAIEAVSNVYTLIKELENG